MKLHLKQTKKHRVDEWPVKLAKNNRKQINNDGVVKDNCSTKKRKKKIYSNQ